MRLFVSVPVDVLISFLSLFAYTHTERILSVCMREVKTTAFLEFLCWCLDLYVCVFIYT